MALPASRVLAVGLALAVPLAARAATITIQNVDNPGEGFNDPTPATPVGGNQGTTVGEQRMNVFKKVAQLWGDALVSAVPIVADASFAPLTCSTNQIMLGQAAYTRSVSNMPGLPPDVWVPIALANALTGSDQNGTEAEIAAMFNGGLSDCSMNLQNWYYGLDGQAGDDVDLLAVVLHEFGHGLGFASVIDPSNGQAQSGLLDAFVTNVYDNGTNKAWTDMTDAERATSAKNARHLVWSGPNVMRQMPQVLGLGSPTITVTPAQSGLGGHLTESELGPYLAMKPVSGILKVGKVVSPCTISGSVTNAIVLFADMNLCPPVQAAFLAQKAGAIGAMFEDPVGADPPYAVSVLPSIQDYGPVTIPTVSVSSHDVQVLSLAAGGSGSVMVSLGAVADQRVGADGMGRTDLFASNPVLGASTLSHWDPLARPDLLMEPQIASKATHDQRMELAAFRDMGWKTVCGNGTMDSGEQCDLGDQNGVAGSGCYADCTTAPITAGTGGAAGAGTGGAGTAGNPGSGGMLGTGGLGDASGGTTGFGTGGVRTGGTSGFATGGTPASGGTSGSGGLTGSGGTVATGTGGTSAPNATGGSSSGCSCETGGGTPSQGLSVLFLAGVFMLRRRRIG